MKILQFVLAFLGHFIFSGADLCLLAVLVFAHSREWIQIELWVPSYLEKGVKDL